MQHGLRPYPVDLDLAKQTCLSVIVPGANEGIEIQRTIQSILERKGEVGKLEIVGVDDASDDKSWDSVASAEVQVVRNDVRQGAGRSKNIGYKRCSGNPVFVDAHMRFPPGSLAWIGAALHQRECMTCCGVQGIEKVGGCQGYGAYFRFHRRGRLGVRYYHPVDEKGKPAPWPDGCGLQVEMPFGGAYGYSRSAFERVGGWTDVAAKWGYCEQPMGFLSWALGIPVIALPPVIKHKFRKINPSGANESDLWRNVAYAHAVLFQDGTNQSYWKTIIETSLGPVMAAQIAASPEAVRHREHVRKQITKPDAEFFRDILQAKVEAAPDGSVRKVVVASIILPSYNEGADPQLTVRGLMANTISDPEVILVDDASTDGSCGRWSPRRKGRRIFAAHIRILRNDTRQGVTRSRLVGVHAAKEDLLLFLDSHSRPRFGDIEKLVQAAYDTKALIVGTICGYDETNKPMYPGRFCVKPLWGLRLAYYRQKPGTGDLNPINGPIGSVYAIVRDTLKRVRSWPALPGKWAYSEQALGIKCWALGIPILNDSRVLIEHRMKKGTIDVPLEDVLLNAHFVHRAYFDEDTYSDIWRPLLLERGFTPRIDEMLNSRLLLDEAEWFQANRRTTDEQFFRSILGATPADNIDIDVKAGTAKPRTHAAYVAYEARRSPGREWTADRPRLERHAADLLAALDGNPLGEVKLLDVGSRDGWWLDLLVQKGFSKEKVEGLEVCPWSAKHARTMGRNVATGDAHDLRRWADRSQDLVTFIHALEHCHDPMKALGEVKRVLRDGGILMVVVPIEPTGLSVKGDHCAAMRSDEAVLKLVSESGFQIAGHRRKGTELTLFARKPGELT